MEALGDVARVAVGIERRVYTPTHADQDKVIEFTWTSSRGVKASSVVDGASFVRARFCPRFRDF
jgi:hypothetical protein